MEHYDRTKISRPVAIFMGFAKTLDGEYARHGAFTDAPHTVV